MASMTAAALLKDPQFLKTAAQRLQQLGHQGDSELVHVNAQEAALLKANGGVGSVNPNTGLRQYYGGTDGNDGAESEAASAAAQGTNDTSDHGHDLGHGEYGPGAPSSVGTTGQEGSLNSIGALGRGSLEAQRDDAAVNEMTVNPGHVSGVNAASSVMDGLAPSFSDRVGDFFGQNNPGGFFGSNAVQAAAGLAGGAIAGPFGAMAAKGAVGMAQGRGLEGSFGSLGTGLQSAIDHGVSGPASAQSQSTATDASGNPIAPPVAQPTGQVYAPPIDTGPLSPFTPWGTQMPRRLM